MFIDPAEIFKVLSVDTRIQIIEYLKANGPTGAKELSEKLGLSTAAISQHLKILKHAGLVRSERQGYWIPYSIDEKALENCREVLNEVCTCGCEGTGKFREKEINQANLAALKKYEIELQKELDRVRNRVSKIQSEN
ncbi:MAG: metalloregulator ArsR/SmtB family transcription factor [Desulfocapsaceae bacterium]|nr:metalloregulator ArsR/SmtB family transcription factor [Desulfocapsaceae bacterium]